MGSLVHQAESSSIVTMITFQEWISLTLNGAHQLILMDKLSFIMYFYIQYIFHDFHEL